MNAIRSLVMLCIFQSSHLVQSKSEVNKKSVAKSQEVETFTTILLDDEAYSIQSAEKKLKKQHSGVQADENDKILKSKVLKNAPHGSKGSRIRKPDKKLSKAKPSRAALKNNVHSKDDVHLNKNSQLKNKKKISRRKSIMNLSKKLRKRQFDAQNANQWNREQSNQGYYYNQNYPSVSNPFSMSSTSENLHSKVAENFPTASTSFYIVTVNNSNSSYDSYNSPQSFVEHNPDSTLYRAYREPETNIAKKSEPSVGFQPRMAPANYPTNNRSSNLHGGNFHKQKIHVSNVRPQHVITSEKSPETTTPKFFEKTFIQGDTVQRSPHASSHRQKSEKEKIEEQLQSDETEGDDTTIDFGGNCEQIINETCWITREIGDVLTLTVEIQSSKDLSSFQVRWLKVYHMYGLKKGKPLEVKPDKLAWNMVSGSEGRELRLNPVTNTDIDPNCIVAKVFLMSKRGGKVLYTFMKRVIYRIDIPVIDMGKIYSGEELSIYLENFISLPERGNLLFDWSLETRPHELQSLPSNIKISNSGRSVVLKELKKGRLGILNCVIYSTSRFSVAKRRFNILKIGESVKRRSTLQHSGESKRSPTAKNLRCRRVIRRSQKEAMQRLEELTRPKSRKKRFKRSETVTKFLECEPLRKKLYSRWIRSLFGDSATEDSRLMPLEKLFELSEEGDGTLDDVIPHEVHYVHPNVRVMSGTSGERSVNQLSIFRNCTSDADCGNNSICARTSGSQKDSGIVRYCYCRPNFYGDGYSCKKIPLSQHRDKRLKRGAQKDLAVPQHLFYEGAVQRSATRIAEEQTEESSESPPKVLAFEEEESFLLTDCIDDRDCSSHAGCVQPTNGHPYCKCRPGFRGSGVFCWEIIDYVPPEESLQSEEELYPEETNYPNQNGDRLSSVTPVPNDLEEE